MKVPNFVSYLIEFFQEVEKASSSNSKLNNEKPLNYVDFYKEKLNSKDLNYLEKNKLEKYSNDLMNIPISSNQ